GVRRCDGVGAVGEYARRDRVSAVRGRGGADQGAVAVELDRAADRGGADERRRGDAGDVVVVVQPVVAGERQAGCGRGRRAGRGGRVDGGVELQVEADVGAVRAGLVDLDGQDVRAADQAGRVERRQL